MPQMSKVMSRVQSYSTWDAHRLQQIFKWTVYILLIVNFGFYIADDWARASLTLNDQSTLIQRLNEFATTIDESAWFILILMLELETYVLDDRHFKRWVSLLLHWVRLVCFCMIAYTIFAFTQYVFQVTTTVPVENVSSLCELASQSVSFTYNLEYTAITDESCRQLSSDSSFYWLGGETVVTDTSGLELERWLAWADFAEVSLWIVIIALIEVVVRLQDRGIAEGRLISTFNRIKTAGYGLLLCLGVYWASLSHWLYLWDTILWVGGFAAIEMNLSGWRDELNEHESLGGIGDVAGSL